MRLIARIIAVALTVWTVLSGETAMAIEGLITAKSTYDVNETVDALEADVKTKGMTVFARIDHAAGAEAVGLSLRPTIVVIFGAAKGGTPLMQAAQTIGIDLPLKALVYEGSDGLTYVSYNDPAYLARRHGIDATNNQAVHAMSEMLKAVVAKATGPK
jgi:uncharacterized protein (DUF302 family)